MTDRIHITIQTAQADAGSDEVVARGVTVRQGSIPVMEFFFSGTESQAANLASALGDLKSFNARVFGGVRSE